MKKNKKELKDHFNVHEELLDIPEEEILTYKIEGLSAPHINKPYSHYRLKKIIFVLVIIVAVSISMYFSVRVVHKETFEYTPLESGTYELEKFGNTGFIKELTVDFVADITYDDTVTDPEKNFSIVTDTSKPVTKIKEYAFNCDSTLETVYIGEGVTDIDGKAFYSCWALKAIEVDENNPAYCDIDGVLYSKDKKTVICYPCDHDRYLREKYGYEEELFADNEDKALFEKYKKEVMTYVVPSSVETIGELCFNYSNLADIYLPEGLRKIESLGFFEMPNFAGLYTYIADSAVVSTDLSAVDGKEIYLSLPEGLEYIGSDAFSYNQSMNYIFIPDSVTYIGHHAFWDTVYTKDGELAGISQINVALDEDTFDETVETGDQWVPQHDKNLLRKIDVIYSAQRKPM